MLKKRLISLGVAVVFSLSSLTVPVSADSFELKVKDNKIEVKYNPGKGNGNMKGNKNGWNKLWFNDLDDVSWAIDAINKIASKGILNGIGQNKFSPRGTVTQLEAIASVLKLTGDNTLAQTYDKKVHPLYKGIQPLWGMGYIYLAIEKDILLKEELADFKPNNPVKRHEMAKYIIRALGKTDEALDHMDEKLDFKDKKSIPAKSVGYVYLINKYGIMSGNNNEFRPMAALSRAELAIILDRADSIGVLPDTSNRKNNIVFVSLNDDDNKITVNKNNTKYTYEYVDDVPVYKNSGFCDIDDLVKGDVMQLVFNDDNEIIFIEVFRNSDDNDDDYDEISFSKVSYNSLPKKLKDEVDRLKKSENYRAYEYDNYIYLIAAMGKKNTGGYSIEIEDVYRIENSNDEYTVKAVVETDNPSSGKPVTQAITYPYTVVRFKSFDDIENVVFVDDDGDELEDVKIKDIDEITTVEGEIYDIISSSKTIRIEKLNGTKVSYKIPSSAEIIVNDDDDAEFSDLDKGMSVEIELTDNKVTKVVAEDNDIEDISFDTIDYSDLSKTLKEQVDYLKLTKQYKAYKYNNYIYLIASMGKKTTGGYDIDITDVYRTEYSDGDFRLTAVVEIDDTSNNKKVSGDDAYPYSIVRFKYFDNIETIRFVDDDNNKLSEVKLVELDESSVVKGTIYSVNNNGKVLKVQKSDGSIVSFTVPKDADIYINDEDEDFSDLEKNMKVEVVTVDGKVAKITAEDSITEVKGTLTRMMIGANKKEIAVKIGNSTKTYTVDSNVKIIIDNKNAKLEQLTVNNEIKLRFSNGLLVEIEK